MNWIASLRLLSLPNTFVKGVSIVLLSCFLASCDDAGDHKYNPPVNNPSVELPEVKQLLTTADQTALFTLKQQSISPLSNSASHTITIDAASSFQSMDGFGFALTGGSAKHLSEMSASAKNTLLNELFGNGEGQIGMSFIRISIGASDLDENVFSYNDLSSGETDVNQEKFSLDPDQARLIPLLKEIIAVQPTIKIMASPWSAPAWMKTNYDPKGGSLQKQYFDSYALYLSKYILAMRDEGINISHMSIQNEPLHAGNNPSMYMSASDQGEFIKNSLGPLFEENGITTKIIIYDHNPDRSDYPLAILNDEVARQYVDGSAFHLYGGSISTLSDVRDQHPDKNIYFTEQWFGAPGNFSEDLKWHMREVVIGSTRNWSRNVIEWNLSSNPALEPHTDGGCGQCLGGITINGDQITRNAGYYVIAHISKYVTPDAIRIASNELDALPNVAFLTADGQVVLVVLNNTDATLSFNVMQEATEFSCLIEAGAVSTFVWTKS